MIVHWIQQQLVSILVVVFTIMCTLLAIQSVRLNSAKSNVLLLTSKLETAEVLNVANAGTLRQYRMDQEALSQRVVAAQNEIIASEKQHAETMKAILLELPPPETGTCSDMAAWARKLATRRQK